MEKVLVIVAHPDDETIWSGGTLLENAGKWDIEIISLCRRDDADRAPKFMKVCQEYNAKCYMSDLEDEKLFTMESREIISRIMKFAGKEYDLIITHGENGEYGHIRHIEVHRAVLEILGKGLIKAKKVFFFSYIKRGKYAYPDKNSDKFIYLQSDDFLRKKMIIKETYGFKKDGFEEICCRDVESFKIMILK